MLIAEVRELGPDSALGFDQQHLAWLLGGRHDKCGVRRWMPEGPTNDSAPLAAQTAAGAADPMNSSVGSLTSGDGSSLERNPAGAITLARFLMRIVSLRANIIKSRWGLLSNAILDGVPYSSTGQRPDG
jgi:hypothetical protein